jgi:YD repeat-containing protein
MSASHLSYTDNVPPSRGDKLQRLGVLFSAVGLAVCVAPAAATTYKYSTNPTALGWFASPTDACDALALVWNNGNGASPTNPNHQWISSHSVNSAGDTCEVKYYQDTDPTRQLSSTYYSIQRQICTTDCPSSPTPPPPPPPPPPAPPPISQSDCANMPGMKWNSADGICSYVKHQLRGNNTPGACPGSPVPADGAGNPIYPATGAKRENVYTLLQLGSLPLKLTYDSSRRVTSPGMAAASDAPSFGALWFSSFHRSLESALNLVGIAHRGDGRVISLPGGKNVTESVMTLSGGGFALRDASGQAVEIYDVNGRLSSLTYVNGEVITFAYSDSSTSATIAPAPGYLIQASDAFGRTIKLEYQLPTGGAPATDGRVSKITDPAGQAALVSYDAATGNLKQIIWADGRSRQFVYENASFPWALTGVVDERGIRYSTFGYDTQGNAISTEHAGGVDRYSVSSSSAPKAVLNEVYDGPSNTFFEYHDWQAAGTPVLTLPNGSKVNLGISVVQGYPRISTRNQPAGSGCLAATSSVTFDDNGNPATVDDFNGNRTCSVFDMTRNLETSRIEGLPLSSPCLSSASSRQVTTKWHPDWPLRVQLAEPKKMTYWIYNGEKDPQTGVVVSCAPSIAKLPSLNRPIVVLCKKVEQVTLDESGASGLFPKYAATPVRTWQWTYNQYGQVLTATDPLNNTTTYTYYTDTTADHMVGDLQTATNPVGQSVQYVKYDRLGHLMRSIEPNGTAVDMAYTPRGWLNSVTMTPQGGSAQTTTIGHNEVGQVNSVQLPDGTSLTYGYDDAQRLTSITDTAGNTVTYTLDNAGNRKNEQLKDASGTLVRNITRAYDALNRLQSVTGAAR